MNTLVPPSYRCFPYNFAFIGQAVSENIFEKCGRRRTLESYCLKDTKSGASARTAGSEFHKGEKLYNII